MIITTLIIPALNDSDEVLGNIADFIFLLDDNFLWHISAYYPTYKHNDQHGTPVQILRKAREIGLNAGLRYVNEANAFGETAESTCCYSCRRLLIKKRGFTIERYPINEKKYPDCQAHFWEAGRHEI